MKAKSFELVPWHNCQRVMMPSEGQEEELKCVGEIYDKTFVTKRDPRKHVMRKWDAYGINQTIIDSGLIEMIVFEEPDGKCWMITLEDFKSSARLHREEGEEKQYFIPREKLTQL